MTIAKTMGADHLVEVLKEIRQDYYSLLAQLYNTGISNRDTESLIKFTNAEFLEEIEFQRELKTAFQLNERSSLKKKFQAIEKESEISPEEINQAYKLIERQKLKEEFEKIEYKTDADKYGLVGESSESYLINQNIKTEGKTASLIQFNWKRFAIAASIIGLILTAGYLFVMPKYKDSEDRLAKSRDKEMQLFGKDNEVKGIEKKYKIKEQKSSIYTGNDSISVEVRDVKALAGLIDIKKAFLAGETNNTKGLRQIEKNNRHILDSLNSLQKYLLSLTNTYSYNIDQKTIVLNISGSDNVKGVFWYVSDMKNKICYIDVNNAFYAIKKSKGIMAMQKEVNKNILIELVKIKSEEK